MVPSEGVTSPGFVLGSDTAKSCWLCDRKAGQLCHVHDPDFVRMRAEREEKRDELDPVVVEVQDVG
jgi:hypothetical protein